MSLKLDDVFFEKLLLTAKENPRKRSHFNLHSDLNEAVQRLCVGLIKGTYVRPHHHPDKNKWELMLVLRGRVGLTIFDHNGVVLESLSLAQGDALNGIELTPGTWHSVYALSDEAVILEIKQGPYAPFCASDYADWSPAEGDDEVGRFLHWLPLAKAGEQFVQQ